MDPRFSLVAEKGERGGQMWMSVDHDGPHAQGFGVEVKARGSTVSLFVDDDGAEKVTLGDRILEEQ